MQNGKSLGCLPRYPLQNRRLPLCKGSHYAKVTAQENVKRIKMDSAYL